MGGGGEVVLLDKKQENNLAFTRLDKPKNNSTIGFCNTPILLKCLETGDLVELRCKRWICEYCARINNFKLSSKISEIVQRWDRIRFITLTVDPSIGDEYIDEGFNNCVTQLRKYVKGLEFIKVKEFMDNGIQHLHVITNRYIPKELLARYWVLGWSDIRLHRKFNRYYMLKYLTKPKNQLLFHYRERRFSLPHGFPIFTHEVSFLNWEFVGMVDFGAFCPIKLPSQWAVSTNWPNFGIAEAINLEPNYSCPPTQNKFSYKYITSPRD